jgi:hypothetical protein
MEVDPQIYIIISPYRLKSLKKIRTINSVSNFLTFGFEKYQINLIENILNC